MTDFEKAAAEFDFKAANFSMVLIILAFRKVIEV
jgi:hypothetical protein